MAVALRLPPDPADNFRRGKPWRIWGKTPNADSFGKQKKRELPEYFRREKGKMLPDFYKFQRLVPVIRPDASR